MKYSLIMLLVFASFTAFSQSKSGRPGTNRGTTQKKTIKAAIKHQNSINKGTSTNIPGTSNSTQSTTPGTPIGTGGAGGDEMAGSRAGSKAETDINKTNSAPGQQAQGTSQEKIIQGAIEHDKSSNNATSTNIPGTSNSTQSTTPGAPIGTGGAGGDTMSGSRAGSKNQRQVNKQGNNNSNRGNTNAQNRTTQGRQ